MYWLGLILLVLGVLLLGLSNPWQFFQTSGGSFLDFTEVFWSLQWAGFWLVCASLLVFGSLAWKTPSAFTPPWRLAPPGIALAMLALFFVHSMPEKSNQRDWKNGWLGARVYVRTKMWLRGDDAGESAIPDRLSGRWEAAGGISFTISRDAIRVASPDGETVWSERDCRHRFQAEYDFTYRSNLTESSPSGIRFGALDHKGAATWIELPDRRFPRLLCSCDSKTARWVLVDIDRLAAIMESGKVLLARRS